MANLNRERRRYNEGDRPKGRRPPSQRKPQRRLTCPTGTFDVFIVRSWDGMVSRAHGAYLNEDKAYERADLLFYKPEYRGRALTVDHKAGIRLSDGTVYTVNLIPVKLEDEELEHETVALQNDEPQPDRSPADRPRARAALLSPFPSEP